MPDKSSSLAGGYFLTIPPAVYDRTITTHPWIDQMRARVLFRVIQHLGPNFSGKRALDVGTGTGLLVRTLQGVPGLDIAACDTDERIKAFFDKDPQLRGVPVAILDALADPLGPNVDLIVSSGVFHHIPVAKRPTFLHRLAQHAETVIVADEGLGAYTSSEERIHNCDRWYSHVIGEARRRGLIELVNLESRFWQADRESTGADDRDHKQSPEVIQEYLDALGLNVFSLDLLGPWLEHRGGFFVLTYQGTSAAARGNK